MWQLYPKEIFVDVEEGRLFAYLYPPHTLPLDLRRYSNIFGTGEFDRVGPASATGVSKTHEVLFYFHSGGYREANSQEINRNFQEGGLFLVEPDWYVKSGAIGKIHIYDPENFPETERLLMKGSSPTPPTLCWKTRRHSGGMGCWIMGISSRSINIPAAGAYAREA
ncbi:MAG: hypothetical protein AMS15_09715 [Planctomycetes bacterium DG_23]|nr:MAG: hypothetical protein AMS15_09715 [Planctomycetes bacterium DG_23]